MTLWTYLLPVLFALFVWWFSTGIVLLLDHLPRRTFPWSMGVASLAALLALVGLVRTSDDTTVLSAYLAFSYGVVIWGWQEMAFLTGWITGPRRVVASAGGSRWQHFFEAIGAILHHELVIIAAAALVIGLTWGAPNQVGAWTFIVLWAMRQSAKLNLFFGVRNLSEEFLPAHLKYMQTYFRRRRMNALWPVSVLGAALVFVLMLQKIAAPAASAFDVAGLGLVASLLGLAILEHLFLVIPLPFNALWRWSLRNRPVAAELAADPIAPIDPIITTLPTSH